MAAAAPQVRRHSMLLEGIPPLGAVLSQIWLSSSAHHAAGCSSNTGKHLDASVIRPAGAGLPSPAIPALHGTCDARTCCKLHVCTLTKEANDARRALVNIPLLSRQALLSLLWAPDRMRRTASQRCRGRASRASCATPTWRAWRASCACAAWMRSARRRARAASASWCTGAPGPAGCALGPAGCPELRALFGCACCARHRLCGVRVAQHGHADALLGACERWAERCRAARRIQRSGRELVYRFQKFVAALMTSARQARLERGPALCVCSVRALSCQLPAASRAPSARSTEPSRRGRQAVLPGVPPKAQPALCRFLAGPTRARRAGGWSRPPSASAGWC